MTSDRIEKYVLLHADVERVWDAVSDSAKFGTWFGMDLDGPFIEGAPVSGRTVATGVDAEIAAQQGPYVGRPLTLRVEAIEPRYRLAFRWNPLPGSEFTDLTTLVEFILTERGEDTGLRIIESGFDALPEERRGATFRGNEHGWELQTQLIGKYLDQAGPAR